MKRIVMVVAAALAAAGCAPGDGPLMDPGEDCLGCHGGGVPPGQSAPLTGGEGGPGWTIAGTVYRTIDAPADAGVQGARVAITDFNGKSFTLRSNEAGNFYTKERVVFPIRVSVNGHEMEDPVEYGGCNGCHRFPNPLNDADGRIALDHVEAPPAP